MTVLDVLPEAIVEEPEGIAHGIAEEPQEEADAAEAEVEEVDRALTLEEQYDEIVLMLAEGKIGIHQFSELHGKAWTAVLRSRGQEDPAVMRQRAESLRRSNSTSKLGVAVTASGFVKKSRASRRSKEHFREATLTGQLPEFPVPA